MTDKSEWFDLLRGESDDEMILPMLSGSMAGTLLPGDLLTVRPIKAGNPHIGDIAVFRDKGKLVAHRLILVFRLSRFSLFVEKGDANRTASRIRPASVVGIVVSARRKGIEVFSRTPETTGLSRRLSKRALIKHLAFEAPMNLVQRILRRDA